jgi:hypothetical protein
MSCAESRLFAVRFAHGQENKCRLSSISRLRFGRTTIQWISSYSGATVPRQRWRKWRHTYDAAAATGLEDL